MMWDQINPWLAGGGLALGGAFGIVAQRSRFCVVAALSNFVLMRDYRQLHAYLAAVAIAVAGTFVLEWSGVVAIADSSYRRPAMNWLGALGGGVVFGIGAILAGGCASRTLVRTAEGNLGALLTLMAFAAAGMATLFGMLDPLRGWVLDRALPLASGDASISVVMTWPLWAAPLGVVLLCLGIVLFLGDWREHKATITGGMVIGLLLVGGWWITGVAGADPFDPTPPASLAMAAPLARTAAWLTMGQSTGTAFALFLVPGVLLGAFSGAIFWGELRWVAPAANRVGAYVAGGALMGIGAVLAGGCNIGQGLSGVATLSLTSLLAATGIVVGMLIGLHWLYRSD